MNAPTTPAPATTEPTVDQTPAPAAAACCGPAKQATCCEPSAKAACCGASPASACGCQG